MLSDFVLDFDECINDSTFRLYFDVNYSNANSNTFELYNNGQFIGDFDFDDLPFGLLFQTSDAPIQHFLMCTGDGQQCCIDAVLPSPNCDESNIEENQFSNLFWSRVGSDVYEVRSPNKIDVMVYDMTGRMLINRNKINEQKIFTSNWVSGVYYISFVRNGHVLTKRIMVLQ